jgi:hypothetical protein
MWYALLVQFWLDVELNIALACVLWKLVLDDGDDGDIVWLHSDGFIFDLHDQVCPRERWFEEVGKCCLITIANDIRHVRYAIRDPL